MTALATRVRKAAARNPAISFVRTSDARDFILRVHISGLRLVSEMNGSHGHWSFKNKRKTHHHTVIHAALGTFRGIVLDRIAMWRERRERVLVVDIVRIGPRTLDSDNVAASAKWCRDSIAARLGVDDGSDKYEWRYSQRKGPYAVEVTIAERIHAERDRAKGAAL